MRFLRIAIVALHVPALFGAYQYYYSETFGSTLDPTKWDTEGPIIISKVPVPDGTWNYEMSNTYSVIQNGNGGLTQYLRATRSYSDSTYANGSRLELTFSSVWFGPCTTTLTLYKQAQIFTTPTRTQLASVNTGCGQNNTVRTIVWNSAYNQVTVGVFYNSALLLQVTTDNGYVAGGPAGQYSRTQGQQVSFGVKDKIAPSPVNGATIGTSVFPTEIDAQWQPAVDDANGVGVWEYQIYRNGSYWTATTGLSFADKGLSPGTVYTYSIYALDWHFNQSVATTFSVTTAPYGPNPAVVTPPARTGVHTFGSYWGAAGEQVDMLSGNLNFTLPLFKAIGRGAWGQTFALNYNSQIWRLDSGGTWNLGKDVGYGYGWRLMAGSLSPYWSTANTLQYYLFTDSTGAEYKLDINTNGIWTSSQAIYLTYDGANQLLYFPDGSFWKMGCYSGGTEPDAGTRYPSIMQDTNGNQVLIRYQTGKGALWTNSSARITEIEDVRAVYSSSTGTYRTWSFTYNADATPHLTGITNYIGTAETYTFTYLSNQSLASPFSPPVSYPATTLLQTVSNAAQLSHTFEFAGGSGEMSKVTFPYGGMMRWAYRSFNYSGKTVREIQYRYLTKANGATETTYPLTRDDVNNPNNPVNAYTCIVDPSGIGQKCWFFNTTATSWMMGLNTSIEQRPAAGQTAIRRQDITWVQDTAGNPYIGTMLTTLDQATANLQTKTTQSLDTHGNVLQTSIFDYGNLTTAARTYTNTYLTNSNYTSIGIWNRLATSTVTNGSQTVTLITNTYDANALTNVTGLREYAGAGTYRGNVTTSVVPGRTINTTYDITGALVSRNDGQQHTVSVTQSSSTNYAAPSVITINGNTSSNQNMSYTTWLATSSVTGPNSSSASVTYDSFARPATSTSVYGAVTTYGYSAAGVFPYTATATTNNHWTQTMLDGLGRTMKQVRGYNDGSGSHTVSTVDTVYDSCACSPIGKVKQVSQPYAPGGTVYWTTSNYDALGRTSSVVAADGASTSTYAYSGNTTTITDAAGKWKKQSVDAMGNLTQVNEPNPAGGANYVTNYTYDMLSHLTQVSMPRPTGTQTRTFVYDATTQRLNSETHPESGTKTYTYNADGTLAQRTDAKGQVTKYTYDGFQRVTLIQYYASSTSAEDTCQRVTFTYDGGTNGWGRPYTSTWGGGSCSSHGNFTFTYTYGYTPGGLIATKALAAGRNNSLTTIKAGYNYDTEGRVASIAYPDPSTGLPMTTPFTYTFDNMGRPTGLNFNNGATNLVYVQNVQYGPADELLHWSYGAYFTETFHYNTRLQLTEQSLVSAAPGFPLFNAYDISYTYSATQNNGRILQTSNTATGETVSYTYDSLSRLATANGSASSLGAAWGQSFTYDGFGNLTDKNVTAGSAPVLHVTVNAATNRFTGGNFGYDANGNLGYGGSVDANYLFDGENRMVTQWNTSTSTSELYSHGPDNQRVWKRRTDGSEQVTFYGLRGERMGIYQPSFSNHDALASAGTYLLYFAGRPVSYGSDRLGSKRADSPNMQGQTISHTYFPYGEEYTTTTQDTEKFGTYYRDSTTALDYARNRFYSNRLARFMTADPYRNSAGPADPGSWNRYAYTQGDPVNSNDPSGLDCQLVDSGTGIFILLCNYSGGIGGGEGVGAHRAYSDSDQRGGGGGGGGGDPTNKGGWDTDPSGAAKTGWRYLKSIWKKCLDDFKQIRNFKSSQLQQLLTAGLNQGGITFYDTRDPNVGNRTVDSVLQNGDQTSLKNYVGADNADVLGNFTKNVDLGINFFTDLTQTQQIGLTIHEALHIALKIDDIALARTLAGFGFSVNTGTSGDITDWISGGCK